MRIRDPAPSLFGRPPGAGRRPEKEARPLLWNGRARAVLYGVGVCCHEQVHSSPTPPAERDRPRTQGAHRLWNRVLLYEYAYRA